MRVTYDNGGYDQRVPGSQPTEQFDTTIRILGTSEAFKKLMAQCKLLTGHKANILIQGESGTGKELLARYIHGLDAETRSRPFVAVNCAAIPDGIVESELFGHERGSFTGAHQRKVGKFELANGGDIFLDEISSFKSDMQAKILRVLQEKEIVRVGGNSAIPTGFRVISASNEKLEDLVESGKFRLDLYHRLRIVQLTIPPLRERKEDIPILVAYFLEKFSDPNHPKRITTEALSKLTDYSWPGNIRELENVIHSTIIMSAGDIIDSRDLPTWALNGTVNKPSSIVVPSIDNNDELESYSSLKEYIRKAEKHFIEHVLSKTTRDKVKTAEILDIGKSTLYSKLKELGIEE